MSTGIFFKVVDSDDWVNEEAYVQVLDTLRRFVYGERPDMLVTNLSSEKEGPEGKSDEIPHGISKGQGIWME